MGNLHFLEHLNLMFNSIANFPITISNLKKLKALKIGWNDFQLNTDHFELIGQMEDLELLNIAGLYLENFPKEICSLKSLKILSIEDNHIETFPDEIKYLSNLEKIIVKMNPLKEGERNKLIQLLPNVNIVDDVADPDVLGFVRSYNN